jgi:hypothetical protein
MSAPKGCTYEAINPPQPFVFGTVGNQNAANTVYLAMSTINGTQAANFKPIVRQFKSDRERMQYLAGNFARNTDCCNGGARCAKNG